MSFQLQGLLASIQHARGANGIVPGNPASPPGLEAAPHGGHNAAQFYRQDAQGHEGYAAQLWMSRHPHAVKAGMIPGWVSQAMTGQISSALHQPLPAPSAPQTVGQPNMGFGHFPTGGPTGGPTQGGPAYGPTGGDVSSSPAPTNGGAYGPPGPTGGPTGGPLGGPALGGGPTGGGIPPQPPGPTSGPGFIPGGPTQPLGPTHQLAAQRALLGYA